jgi:hypothetical protein
MAFLSFLFDLFGVTINEDKSVLVPASSVEFLGFDIDIAGNLALSARRYSRLHAAA